ncbi:uncharacterized protein [Porites lutea]|uniref:uncharacterized protein n=1 Tax=Porites lutea TaxID=51062 RepID=UPI003CC59400
MKAILALLLCFSLTAAKYLVKRKLEDPPNPPNPAKIMFDVEKKVKTLVECLNKNANKGKEEHTKCFKDVNPPPKFKHCFDKMKQCDLAHKPGPSMLSCLEKLKGCLEHVH